MSKLFISVKNDVKVIIFDCKSGVSPYILYKRVIVRIVIVKFVLYNYLIIITNKFNLHKTKCDKSRNRTNKSGK